LTFGFPEPFEQRINLLMTNKGLIGFGCRKEWVSPNVAPKIWFILSLPIGESLREFLKPLKG